MSPDTAPTRALAELARAGYSSLQHPSMDVDFEVHHFRDRPGYLADLLQAGTQKHRNYLETLTSSAYGLGLVICTNTRRVQDKVVYRHKGGMHDLEPQIQRSQDVHRFRGSARPNLTFLYETGQRFEAIVALDDGNAGPLTMTHAIRLRELLYKISNVAVESAEAPLLSIQSPVQLPIQREAESDEQLIPEAASKAVRFSIALPRPNAKVSLKVADSITSYCREQGFSLWLRDTRPGCRTGNWFEVLGTSRPTASNHGHLTHLMPVTFVGPARIGSTHAILTALRKLRRVGVAGCSITLLDDLAFVHLQLALSSRIADKTAVGPDISTFIRGLHSPGVRQPNRITVAGVADDYQTFAGPQLKYTYRGHDKKVAIWLSWQMNRTTEGLATPLDSLANALRTLRIGWQDTDLRANVEYLVCRDVGNSLRGKGKLSVPYRFIADHFPQDDVEPGPSQLCVALEDAWKSAWKAMATERKSLADVREITVSWREHWLGHWAAPIS